MLGMQGAALGGCPSCLSAPWLRSGVDHQAAWPTRGVLLCVRVAIPLLPQSP